MGLMIDKEIEVCDLSQTLMGGLWGSMESSRGNLLGFEILQEIQMILKWILSPGCWMLVGTTEKDCGGGDGFI